MNLQFNFIEEFAKFNNISNKVYFKDIDTYIYGTEENINSFLQSFDKAFFNLLFSNQVIFVFDKDKYFLYKQINFELFKSSLNSAFSILGDILHEKENS